MHGALGGGHYEAEPIVVERAAVIDVDRLGGLGASELEVDEGPAASSSAGSRERASRTAHVGDRRRRRGLPALGRERRRPETA